MTITRILLCVVLLGSGAGGSFGEVNLNLGTGIRYEHEREDRLPALSLAADFGSANWPVRPEVGLAVGFDPLYGGSETELSAGIVHYWNRSQMRIHLGGGLAAVSTDYGYNQGSSNGAYVHAGLSWALGRRFLLGLDLRGLWADSLEVEGSEFPVGYQQIGFLMGWRF